MAKATTKRTASQNETTIKNLKIGNLIAGVLSVLLRVLFRRSMLTSKSSVFLYAITFAPMWMLSSYLEKIGLPKRDPTTKAVVSSGEDLNQSGIMEYCFDIIYVTWACQVGTGIFGDKFWWLYALIPLFAGFKLWTSVISPLVLGRGSSSADVAASEGDNNMGQSTSKRQEKLKKRQERGDPRVQAKTVKRAS